MLLELPADEDHLEAQVLTALQVHLEIQEHQEDLAHQEVLVHKVHVEHQVSLVLLGKLETLELPVLQDLQGSQV